MPSSRAHAPTTTAGPSTPVARIAASIAAALAGTIVFRRTLDYFFSQDDFLSLARAMGLAPRLDQFWRYLSNQAVWDVMRLCGTTEAWPYHALSLAVHAACVILLHDLMARRVAAPAALLGATFFAVHPALFTSLYWNSAIGDPLSCCFVLVVLHVALRSDRWRWSSVPLFAVGLLAKESIIALPALVAAFRAWAPPDRSAPERPRPRAVDGTVIGLAAVSATYMAYFMASAYGAYFVSRSASAGTEVVHAPYALGLGVNLWENLLTYVGWTVVFANPAIHRFSDAIEPGLHLWAVAAMACWIAGATWAPLRTRGWLFGGTSWLLLVMPVLPLSNHTYHYYLYAPLAGAAWCLAAAADLTLSGRRGAAANAGVPGRRRVGWLIACVGAATLTLNGAMVVSRIETAPFVLPGLRADPTVDRARIARNVQHDLAAAALPPGVTLLFWSPMSASIGAHGEPLGRAAPTPTDWERNVRDALLDGLAVRVMFPQVADVRFVREFRPTPPNEWYAAYKPDGTLRVATSAGVDSILRAGGR